MKTPNIDSYTFGFMIIDGQTHTKDIILLPDRVIGNWRRQEGHVIDLEDVGAIIKAKPEVLVIGTGAFDRVKLSEKLLKYINSSGIQLISLPTGTAWRVYNEKKEEKTVAGAFHLTC